VRRAEFIARTTDEIGPGGRSELSTTARKDCDMTIDDTRKKWLALIVLCLGDLLIVLDISIVNVALPSIREDLGFSEASLAWVINAYTLTFGGFMLLAGRFGDLFGHRRMFVSGVALFTLASLACGLATTSEILVGARAVQGIGGAVVAAVALSLIMTLFTEPAERAKAMGVIGFVAAGGGSIGVLAGGILTDLLSWNWIFLVNLPVGIAVIVSCLLLIPGGRVQQASRSLDLTGAITVTASLLVAVYAVVNGNEQGWTSGRTLGLLGAAAAGLAFFLLLESRVESPLMPLAIFRLRSVAASNVVGILWSAAMFAMFFLSALYLQLVLGYSPLEVGLAFLPANLIMGAFSLGLSARIVMRYGTRIPLVIGMGLVAAGLGLFARVPVDGSFAVDVLPSMVILGVGIGMAMNPLLLAAMSDVRPEDAGVASGIVNTSFMMGGALGLAVLASVASARTGDSTSLQALTEGYQAAFVVGTIFAVAAGAVAAVFLRPAPAGAHAQPEAAVAS
jgi:EmrB/QacA subfamily drug resistance transporter